MSRHITREELRNHKDSQGLWIAIHDKVYDVTQFLDEHPGGEEVLLEQGGGYATEAFEDVGHSTDARELLKKYYVGDLVEADKEKKSSKQTLLPTAPEIGNTSKSWTAWLIPVGVMVGAVLLFRTFLPSHSSTN